MLYREALSIATIRNTLLLGVLCRIPMFAMAVLFTLHLVENITPSYSRAGVITAAMTVAMSISAPWRGHMLDTQGLRRTMVPSIAVLIPTYTGMALVNNYWLLLGLAIIAGGMAIPTFSVIRQVLISNSPLHLRKSTVALDGTITELSFMIGPAVAIWIATAWSTRWTVLLFGLLTVGAASVLTIANPPIVDLHQEDSAPAGNESKLAWVNLRVVGILAAVTGLGFTLAGTDLAVVAGLRSLGRPDAIGWVLAGWGFTSALAGLLYGALPRQIGVSWLLLGLGLLTIPVMGAPNVTVFALLLMAAGLFCAPSLVASVDELQQEVPPRFRGQAMGWQGTAMTIGNASAPPIVGAFMDARGWSSGFLVTGLTGVVIGAALLAVTSLRRRRLAS
ncbi:MFS transporter [Aestuariimicrobium sp. p3-SID1156]|uniref:MFS transporter n=1 Tax=Aestuariimicrobium sp. p3-SID1156 TaxID=2916038 RepID=UPI00223C34EC|nr:MFS transporter [Aestuariimicrobium sp. p3-SID1156]MCT1458175.1 MFS transporter [Aestuariimicrobium sp. p3-SID1156]